MMHRPPLDDLTDPQRQAVLHHDGPLLVLAGPGSGKTTVVTRRIAQLIAEGVRPWQILALTFTNKAAGAMRERVADLCPDAMDGRATPTISTFHAFSARLLRWYSEPAGVHPRFTIYDASDQRDAIKRAVAAAELSTQNFPPARVGSAISDAKQRLMDAAAYAETVGDFVGRGCARIYAAYERILRENDALDFDDLLLVTARLLTDAADVRAELQHRYRYILVDEYQDTNHAQFVIASALAEAHRNLCVVGDPDQSIYAWRGADIKNILDFETQYPEAAVVPLGHNFRSTSAIVAAADQLIRNNRQRKHKDLTSARGAGTQPEAVTVPDEEAEARLIVDTLRRHNEDGVPWREMAVLYRMNALSRVIENALRNATMPYVVARGTAFYERKEVKDALAYLRLVANPGDDIAAARVVNMPPRGIGRTTLDRVEAFGRNQGVRLMDALARTAEGAAIPGVTARPVKAIAKFVGLAHRWVDQAAEPVGDRAPGATLGALVERIVRESGLEGHYKSGAGAETGSAEDERDRAANLEELVTAATTFEMPPPAAGPGQDGAAPSSAADGPLLVGHVLEAYLESVALVSAADDVDPENGAVTLMTLHAAKGLEFDVVAIAGLEEGLLPHGRAGESLNDLEEERRLCFVGMTRARDHLLLTTAASRFHRGMRMRGLPSRFLDEIAGDHVTMSDQAGLDDGFGGRGGGGFDPHSQELERDPWEQELVCNLEIGCRVRHEKFGYGRVVDISKRVSGASAKVRFDKVGEKTLILEYARLERV